MLDKIQTHPARPVRRRDERGMVAIEYAMGVVLIIVIIGVMIVAINGGWFGTLVQGLVTALLDSVKSSFELPSWAVFGKP
ncbi:MAG: hypothetical protein QM708_09885 [Propioniciclava sp.]|uniref:hypothetical protein n=1 Tax=Propioniciclava sp. TaxID=2038686 RepID=UPI0039E53D6B